MWIVDFPTLMLIIFGALDLGVLGLTGYDTAAAIFGPYRNPFLIIIGLSALWQISRQKFL